MVSARDETQATSSLSEEAYELISRFYDGVDELVYQIAEETARRRDPEAAAAGRPVYIEVEDVREAGRQVVEALRRLTESKELPPRLVARLRELSASFDNSNRTDG